MKKASTWRAVIQRNKIIEGKSKSYQKSRRFFACLFYSFIQTEIKYELKKTGKETIRSQEI